MYVWVLLQKLLASFVVFCHAPIWLLRKWEKVKQNDQSKELEKSLCYMGTSAKVVCFLCCILLCACLVAEKMVLLQKFWDHIYNALMIH